MSNAQESAIACLESAAAMLRPGPPTLADFKEARDLAKSGYETLKASYDLLSKGIRTVIEEEEQEEAPLFKGNGEPTPQADVTAGDEGAEESAPEPLPTIGYFDTGVMDAEIVGDGDLVVNGENGNLDSEAISSVVEDEAESPNPQTEDEIIAGLVDKARAIVSGTNKITTREIEKALSVHRSLAKTIMDALEAEGTIDSEGYVTGVQR